MPLDCVCHQRGSGPRSASAAIWPYQTERVTEIADIQGVTHQRTFVTVRQQGFPVPVGREGQSRLWDRAEVAAWAKT